MEDFSADSQGRGRSRTLLVSFPFIHSFIYNFFYLFFDNHVVRGVHSALFGIAVTNAVYYYWYEFVKSVFEGAALPKKALTVGENMLTGAIAGAFTSILTNPIWVINVCFTIWIH